MVTQVSYALCPMSDNLQCGTMEQAKFCWLYYTREQHLFSELQVQTKIDIQHALGIDPIHNQLWHYPFCDLYQHWQLDKLHRLFLGSVKDILIWVQEYLNARNVKNQFDNQFISVPWYLGPQRFSTPFHSSKSGSSQGKEICGMIRRLAMNCAPILFWSNGEGITETGTASDTMVLGAVHAFCEFSILSQHIHSDLFLKALDNVLTRFYQTPDIYGEQWMAKCVKARLNKLVGMESHLPRKQKIQIILTALEVHGVGAT